MRIPAWTPEQKHQPQDLVDAILARRGGELMNLDRALLWSEPVARGWNVYMKNVRTGLPTSRKLCELGICTVALLTDARRSSSTTWVEARRRRSSMTTASRISG